MFDCVMGMLKSDEFQRPINNFIEENCAVFDGDQEHKLEHSTIHTKFVELLEGLLEGFLSDLGVPPEKFVEVCENATTDNLGELIQSQILAMDDFLTFKSMMVKANMDLELQAVRANARRAAAPKALEARKEDLEAKEDLTDAEKLELEEAIRISKEIAALPSPSKEEGVDEAVLASEQEAKLAEMEIKREEAELEMVLAMSLVLEEERARAEAEAAAQAMKDALQLSEADAAAAKAKADAEAAAAAEATAKAGAEAEAAAKAAAEAKLAAEEKARAEAAVAEKVAAEASVAEDAKELVATETAKAAAAPQLTPPAEETPQAAPAANPVAAEAEQKKLKELSNLPPLQTRKPLEDKPVSFGAHTSQSILKEEVKLRQAELLQKKAGENIAAQSEEEKKKAAEEEIKKRSEYLKAQRDRLKKAAPPASAPPPLPAAGPSAESVAKPEADKPVDKYDMRVALAQRFKADMLKRSESLKAQAQ